VAVLQAKTGRQFYLPDENGQAFPAFGRGCLPWIVLGGRGFPSEYV